MKPLVLALSAAVLVLALAACGGGGAESAGPAPNVQVETAPPASSGSTFEVPSMFDYPGQVAEYVAKADAICKTAIDKLDAALAEHPDPWTGPPEEVSAADELAFVISAEALAELRALPPPVAPAINPVALCSHRGRTQDSVDSTTRAEYTAQADAICGAATRRLGVLSVAAPAEALARFEEEALAELRALPQPEADRALLEEAYYAVIQAEIDALREQAAAESAADKVRALLLGYERIHLTHQKHAFAIWYGLRVDCPVPLSA